MREAVRSSGSAMAVSQAVVPLLMAHFGESEVFQLFEAHQTDEEVDEAVTATTPLLAVIGLSIHDPNARLQLFVDGTMFLEPRSILEGLHLLFASYFVLNVAYPATCTSTLEFIQRLFFNINPATGDKRMKSKKTLCDPRVSSLAQALGAFTTLFNVEQDQ